MRIISGIYGRRRFDLPTSFNARPTTDFAKENLFNVLANLTDWEGCEALDLFSGTGSIAFELISRGCSSVTAVESDGRHAAFIGKVAKELNTDALRLIRGDAFRYLNGLKRGFDFIFADPPYTLKELPAIPGLALKEGILRKGGIFVLEHSREHSFSSHPCFREQRVYGSVNFSIFIQAGGFTEGED
jgi:16S rRNA (guanine(966)-N(2))-methyltransferase RsmD